MWNRRQTTKFNGAPYIIQKGAAAIYTEQGKKEIEDNIDYYRDNAKVIMEGLNKCGLAVYGAVNSPYVWCKTPDGMGSWDFFDAAAGAGQCGHDPRRGLRPQRRGLYPAHRLRRC